MIKAIVSNEMLQNDPPPPEISPQASMFSDPALTKLSFYDKQLKWFMRQNIEESLKERLYQDMLARARELYNNIKGEKPLPPNVVTQKMKGEAKVEKLQDMLSKASELYNNIKSEIPPPPINNPPIPQATPSESGTSKPTPSKVKASPSKAVASKVWRRKRRQASPVYSGFKF